jgi:tRNA-2-methylthio-N6-dimethylallyladenosine synthase
VQERYEGLTALQDRISGEENARLLGTPVEVLVSAGEGRRDAETARLSGRSEDNRLVHVDVPEGGPVPRPGDVVSVVVSRTTPHYLIAEPVGDDLAVRRTRAGDAWDRAQAESCALPAHSPGAAPGTVSIGLPTLRAGA